MRYHLLSMRRKLAAAGIVLAFVLSAYLAWQSRDMPHLGYFHDDSLYLVSARSLADGNGYRISSLPETPFQTKYPPLYPFLLSLVWRVNPSFPDVLAGAALLAWLMVPLYVAAARVALADLGVGAREAWLLCGLIAINPYVSLFGISLLSELPFTILLIAALTLTERARRGPAWLAASAGAIAGLAYLTRSAGIVLLASGAVVLLAERRVRHALCYCAAMAPAVLGWTLWTHWHRTPGADRAMLYYTDYLGFYLRDLGSLPLIAWKNLDILVHSLGGMVMFKLGESFAEKSVARVLAAAALVGAFRLARRRGLPAYSAFAAGYLVLLVVWNFSPDERYLLAVFPMLLASFALEFKRLAAALVAAWRSGRVAERAITAGTVALVAALAVVTVQRNVEAYTTMLPGFVRYHRSTLNADTGAYEWIRANLPDDARVLAYDDAVLYLHTGRRACRLVVPPGIYYHEQLQELARLYASSPEYARAHQLNYMLVTEADLAGDLSGEARRAALGGFRTDPRMRLLYDSRAAWVYRIGD